MSDNIEQKDIRLVKMEISNFGINYLHRSNPWAAAWWSAAFPGCGHTSRRTFKRPYLYIRRNDN